MVYSPPTPPYDPTRTYDPADDVPEAPDEVKNTSMAALATLARGMATSNAPGADAPPGGGLRDAVDAYVNSGRPPPGPPGAPVNPYSPGPSGPAGAPQDPYAAAPTSGPPGAAKPQGAPGVALDNPASAAAAEDRAIADQGLTREDAAKAQLAADRKHISDRADIEVGYASALAKNDQQHAIAVQAAERQAASENAAWMQNMEKLVASHPTPGDWWENESGFGKAMWIMSLAFGTAAAAKAPGTKNVGLEMLNHEIDADLAARRERTQRQLEVQKLKGEMLKEGHKQKLADLADEHTQRAGMLGVLEKALELRTTAPGAADDAAASAQAKDYVQSLRASVAKDRFDKSVTLYTSKLNRENQVRIAAMSEGAAMDRAKLSSATELAKAQIEAQVKLGTAAAKGNTESHTIPAASGVSLVDKQGHQAQFSVPKEHSAKVGQSISDATVMASGINNLKKRLSDTGSVDYMMKDENSFNSALADVADQMMVKMGGTRGLTNEQAKSQVYQKLLGENYDSAWSKLKGKPKEEILRVLDRQMQKIPEQLKQELRSVPGSNLADLEGKGYDIALNMNDTEPLETEHPSSTQVLASAGTPVSLDHPQTPADYRKQKEQGTLPGLRPEYQAEVTKALDTWKSFSPEHIGGAFKDAHAKIVDFTNAQAKAHPDRAAEIRAQAEDALVRLNAEEKDAKDTSEKARGDTLEYAVRHGATTVDTMRAAAERYGLKNLDPKEVVSLIDAAERRLADENRATHNKLLR